MDKQLRDGNGKLVGFVRSYSDRDELRNVNGTLKGFYYHKLKKKSEWFGLGSLKPNLKNQTLLSNIWF